jgi:hypothetical protein
MTNINVQEFKKLVDELNMIIQSNTIDTETKWHMVFGDCLASRIRKAGLIAENSVPVSSNKSELEAFLNQCYSKLDYINSIGGN